MMRSALAAAKALLLHLVPADTVPTPTLASFTPSAVSSSGGTLITIKGTGFIYGGSPTPTALFFGLTAVSFAVVDAQTLTAVAPAHATGATTAILYSSGGTVMKGSAVTFT